MKTLEFAVYYVPPVGEFYDTGSQLVGYDIRNQQALELPSQVQPDWVHDATGFGWHCTITDAVTIDEAQLPALTEVVHDTLDCFNPANDYELQKTKVGFWREASNCLIMQCLPNRKLEALHDVLVTRVHPISQGTAYTQQLRDDPEHFSADQPYRRRKTEQFHSPTIFDDYVPHFTCISNYDGPPADRAAHEAYSAGRLADIGHIVCESFCIVTREAGERYFTIAEEIMLR